MGRATHWQKLLRPKRAKAGKRKKRHPVDEPQRETPRPYGTLIRERKDGVLYFSSNDHQGVRCGWTVNAAGNEWLRTRGVRPGHRVDGGIVKALIERNFALKTRALNQASEKAFDGRSYPRSQPATVVGDTKLFERKRAKVGTRSSTSITRK